MLPPAEASVSPPAEASVLPPAEASVRLPARLCRPSANRRLRVASAARRLWVASAARRLWVASAARRLLSPRLAAHNPRLGPVAPARQPSASRQQRLIQVRLPPSPPAHPALPSPSPPAPPRPRPLTHATFLTTSSAFTHPSQTRGHVTRQAASRWGSKTNRKGAARRDAPRAAACARGVEPPARAMIELLDHGLSALRRRGLDKDQVRMCGRAVRSECTSCTPRCTYVP